MGNASDKRKTRRQENWSADGQSLPNQQTEMHHSPANAQPVSMGKSSDFAFSAVMMSAENLTRVPLFTFRYQPCIVSVTTGIRHHELATSLFTFES
jgi:hypothetical protein